MAQIRVKRTGVDFNQFAEKFSIDVKDLKREVMLDMANEIAVNSPVDSGLYAVSHEVRLRSGSFTANRTRPDDLTRVSRDGVSAYPDARQQGLNNMVNDIESIDLSKDTFVFRNPMAYASMIEAGETGDVTGSPPVYGAAAREAPRIIQEAAQRIASRNR